MAPNGNGFVRVGSADSMEEPLLSPGFTSTVERPVEDLLVSRQRAEFSAEPLHYIFPRNEGTTTFRLTLFPTAVNRQGCVATGDERGCRGAQTCRGAIRR